jgi:hypothetical protein
MELEDLKELLKYRVLDGKVLNDALELAYEIGKRDQLKHVLNERQAGKESKIPNDIKTEDLCGIL